ncbi:MAG: hypothetical protein OXC57_04645 [Rhodobacteraceae bacterium]|nr:hypothetical protein [Paracoccaceae bacterium]
MLQPKKPRYRKQHKGRIHGNSKGEILEHDPSARDRRDQVLREGGLASRGGKS